MHQIRVALRGKGVVLMGKNTMVRRALRTILSEYPQFERLLPHVKGNIGFVFTSQDLKEVREIITANKVAAPARAGALAPKDVIVPAGNTGMEPGKTSFFQALGIPTKIARGTIEIVSDVKVVTAGTRVGPSEATLLNMLNISPFTYGMTVVQIFDSGNVFSPEVLDISDEELVGRFLSGIKTIAAISLAINFPTLVSVTHSLVNAYKNLIAVSLATEYTFEGSEKVRFAFCYRCSSDLFFKKTLKILSAHGVCCYLSLYDGALGNFFRLTCTNLQCIFRPRSILPIPRHSPRLPLLLPLRIRLLLLLRPRLRRRLRRLRNRTTIWYASFNSMKVYILTSRCLQGFGLFD
jgi:large subunit ribosomal protein LP0